MLNVKDRSVYLSIFAILVIVNFAFVFIPLLPFSVYNFNENHNLGSRKIKEDSYTFSYREELEINTRKEWIKGSLWFNIATDLDSQNENELSVEEEERFYKKAMETTLL